MSGYFAALVLVFLFQPSEGDAKCDVHLTSRIEPFQMSASSHMEGYHAKNGRVGNGMKTGWCSSPTDTEPYLQIDFLTEVMVQYVEARGWTECVDDQSHLKIRQPRNFVLSYGNDSLDVVNAERVGANMDADYQGAVFSRNVSIFSRFLRIYPRRSNTTEICMKVLVLGCGDSTVSVNYVPGNGSFDLGLFEVDELFFSRKATLFSQTGVSNSSTCVDRCTENTSCIAVTYTQGKNECSVYGKFSNDLAVHINASDEYIILQRLFRNSAKYSNFAGIPIVQGDTPLVIGSPAFVIDYTHSKVNRSYWLALGNSPRFYFTSALRKGGTVCWSVDFTSSDMYPHFLFKFYSYGAALYGEEVHFGKLQVNDFDMTWTSPKSKMNLYYGRANSVIDVSDVISTSNRFRAIVISSVYPGCRLDHAELQQKCLFYSPSFTGYDASTSYQYKIHFPDAFLETHPPVLVQLDIEVFHVSCGTGSTFRVVTSIVERDYCNLKRPWRRLIFPPNHAPITLFFFFNKLSDERPVDGILSRFSSAGLFEEAVDSTVSSRYATENVSVCSFGTVDLVFIIDSSASVTSGNFNFVLNFVKRIISFIDIKTTHSRIGVITFSTGTRVEFHLNKFYTDEELFNAIDKIQYMYGGTNTADALRVAHEEMFTVEHGDRPGEQNVIILLTDGISNINARRTIPEADEAKRKGIHIIVLGIGLYDVREALGIASSPSARNSLLFASFLELVQTTNYRLFHTLCPESDIDLESFVISKNYDRRLDEVCSFEAIDLVFIIDSSTSVTQANFDKILLLVREIVTFIDIRKTRSRIGVITFSTDIRVEFYLNKFLTEEELLNAIGQIQYMYGYTNMADALRAAHEEMFTVENGDRPEEKNVIILLTDGVSNVNSRRTLPEADEAKNNGIHIIVVAIQMLTLREACAIASSASEPNCLAYDSFAELFSLSNYQIFQALCQASDVLYTPETHYERQRYEVCTENSCYVLFEGSTTLGEPLLINRKRAETACKQEVNGSLASIHSLKELRYIRHYLEKWLKLQYPRTKYVHIGSLTFSGHDSDKQMYHWSDGTPVTFTAWSKKIPFLAFRDRCVVLDLWDTIGDEVWNNGNCEETSFNFLCKNITKILDYHKPLPLPSVRNYPINNSTHYPCESGEVVSWFAVCNGHKDCKDGGDELECNINEADCAGMFQCKTGECVPYSKYCDHFNDCKDHSDENQCDFGHGPELWSCQSRAMVPSTARCNGSFECLDKSDELKCEECNNKKTAVWCGENSGCIPHERVCDGFLDCPNGQNIDEKDCIPEQLGSCAEWWDKGFRKTGLYQLWDGKDTVTAECNFDKTLHNGQSHTAFHNIDFSPSNKLWEFSNAELVYESRNYVHKHVSAKDVSNALVCEQSFTQICLPNRRAISEHIDLKYHPEYWDCLCIKQSLINECKKGTCHIASRNLSACSQTTQQLVDEGIVSLQDYWAYGQPTTIVPTEIKRKIKGRTSLYLDPITCEEADAISRASINTIACRRGKPVPSRYACLYNYDEWGHITGCTDMTHLQSCEEFVCPAGYLKCPRSFCIAVRFRCDGQADCPGGEDEIQCNDTGTLKPSCVGYFRCMKTNVCLPEEQVCDGEKHCPYGDDERLCEFTCPHWCHCEGYEAACVELSLDKVINVTSNMPANVRKLDFSKSVTKELPTLALQFLGLLNMSNSKLDNIVAKTFSSLRNLLVLDLSFNGITELVTGTFNGLKRLTTLLLDGNHYLKDLAPGAFEGLNDISTLKISYTKIRFISKGTFSGLSTLTSLDLSNNLITRIDSGGFQGLSKLESLDVTRNYIAEFDDEIFAGLDGLVYLKSDAYMFCCLKPPSVIDDYCTPSANEFSSCADLMRNEAPRFLLWFIGFLALGGNVLSLLYRFFYDRERLKLGYGVFVTNLSIADLLMGVYLIIVAGADIFYRHRYIWNDEAWRNSTLCSFAGFLSTVSSEGSVLFICLITVDRILVIKYPFGHWKFTTRKALLASAISWILVLSMATIPFLFTSYFRGEFYSKSVVCLALPLTRDHPAGWEYSISIFIFFNFLTFVLIAFGQALIYQAVSASGKSAKLRRRKNDLTVARNLLLVVSTDFLCWCPIGIMGIMAMTGFVIPGEVYVWATVLILPINSALNPFLYTLSAITRRKKFAPSLDEQSETTSIDKSVLRKLFNTGLYFGKDTRILEHVCGQLPTLRNYMIKHPTLELQMAVKITQMISERVTFLHEMNLFAGCIDYDTILIAAEGESIFEIGMCISPKLATKEEDQAGDLRSLDILRRSLLDASDRDLPRNLVDTSKRNLPGDLLDTSDRDTPEDILDDNKRDLTCDLSDESKRDLTGDRLDDSEVGITKDRLGASDEVLKRGLIVESNKNHPEPDTTDEKESSV